MKIAEVDVGGRYTAKVSGRLTTVRVLAVREVPPPWHGTGNHRWQTRIDVLNESTGRKTTFASAARLRARAGRPEPGA